MARATVSSSGGGGFQSNLGYFVVVVVVYVWGGKSTKVVAVAMTDLGLDLEFSVLGLAAHLPWPIWVLGPFHVF